MATNELRQIIQKRLNAIKTEYGIHEISYRIAYDEQMFPHVVYDFSDVAPADMGRLDFTLDFHIWDKNQYTAFQIMDAIRELFAFWNAPDALTAQTIYPTFYELSGGSVDDPDKTIVHLVLRFQGQAYDGSATDAEVLRDKEPVTVTTGSQSTGG